MYSTSWFNGFSKKCIHVQYASIFFNCLLCRRKSSPTSSSRNLISDHWEAGETLPILEGHTLSGKLWSEKGIAGLPVLESDTIEIIDENYGNM